MFQPYHSAWPFSCGAAQASKYEVSKGLVDIKKFKVYFVCHLFNLIPINYYN